MPPVVPSRLDEQKMAAARLAASARLPYLASAIFAARTVVATGSGTISVDRTWQIYADPATVEGLDVETISRLLLHHIGHLLRFYRQEPGTVAGG